jgi:hypothetical protein
MSEALGHGVTREWLEGEQIMVLKMPKNADRDAINIWFNTTVEAAASWDRSRPFLVIHDNRELGFSTNFRDKAMELAKNTPDNLQGRAAVVLDSGVIGHLLGIVARVSGSRVKEQELEISVFNDYDKALGWLKELL